MHSKETREKIPIQPPPGLPASMVAEYIDRCLAALPAARAALDGLRLDYLRVYGHGLKGSGGGYGIPRLTEMGSGIEDAARRADAAALRNQFAQLEIYLSRLDIRPE
jgi:HPt (histidine-containing phosphotransfer) domain-containing protein